MITVDPNSVFRENIPNTINGETMIDRVTSSEFSRSSTFRDPIIRFAPGALRWPSFGHGANRVFHFDEPHTYASKTGPFPDLSAKTKGDLWDPNYVLSDAGPLSEIISTSDFCLITKMLPEVIPFLIMNWRSGVETGWRDPYPKDIDGNPISGAGMTPAEFMKLSNRRMLKSFKAQSGLSYFLVSVAGEDWLGWDDDDPGDQHIQWPLPDDHGDNKFNFITDKQAEFLADLRSYAESQSWNDIRWVSTFTEATSGGSVIPLGPTTIETYQRHLGYLFSKAGANLDYIGCTLHYRGDWPVFLTQDELLFAFLRDEGQGTLAENRAFIHDFAADAGYPDVDFIPLENGVGDPLDGYSGVDMTQWQKGLAAVQYRIELIKAGYAFAFHYSGFGGEHQLAGLNMITALTGVPQGDASRTFTIQPQFYALETFGPVLKNGPDAISTTSDETRLPHIVLRWEDSGLRVYSIWLVNKTSARIIPLVILSNGSIGVRLVRRYSETETTNPIVTDAVRPDGNTLYVAMPEYSVLYLEILETEYNDLKHHDMIIPARKPFTMGKDWKL